MFCLDAIMSVQDGDLSHTGMFLVFLRLFLVFLRIW